VSCTRGSTPSSAARPKTASYLRRKNRSTKMVRVEYRREKNDHELRQLRPSLADRKRRVIGLGVFGTTPGERLLSLGAQIARMAPAQFFSVGPLIDH
jgi:hypothetical protein